MKGASSKTSLYGASAEYALHSLLIMVARTEPVSVRDLARFQKLPERFLAKLFTRLKKAGIVSGTEGIKGGFVLARPPEQISVRDVLEAIDPNRSLFECGEIRRNCELYDGEPPPWSVKGPCRIHLVMQEAETALRNVLSAKSLADLGHEFGCKAPAQFCQSTESWFQDRRCERTNRKRGEAPSDGSPQPCSLSKQCQSKPKNRRKTR